MTAISNDGKYSGAHTFTFTETRWYERVRKFLPYLPREIPLFAAVAASSWGVAEIVAEASGAKVALRELAVPALVISCAVAVYRAFSKYRSYVPEALVKESRTTQEIFRKGASGWQFGMARQMLTERLAMADRTLSRVESGAEFIRSKQLPIDEYTKWLQDRPSIISRLGHSVAVQCTSDLPRTLASVKSEDQLTDLKAGVSQLAALYSFAAEFEVECHGVQPPEPFEELHQMTRGWSGPIRDGIREFLAILAQLETVNRKALIAGTARVPNFNIAFDPPPTLSEFSRQLQALDIDAIVEATLCP